MKKKMIPVRDFDLVRLIDAIVHFIGDPMFAFPVVNENMDKARRWVHKLGVVAPIAA